MTTKKELEEQIESLRELINSLLLERESLEMRVKESDSLIMHYEKTIAVILARKLEQQSALSSQPTVGNMPNPQV